MWWFIGDSSWERAEIWAACMVFIVDYWYMALIWSCWRPCTVALCCGWIWDEGFNSCLVGKSVFRKQEVKSHKCFYFFFEQITTYLPHLWFDWNLSCLLMIWNLCLIRIMARPEIMLLRFFWPIFVAHCESCM